MDSSNGKMIAKHVLDHHERIKENKETAIRRVLEFYANWEHYNDRTPPHYPVDHDQGTLARRALDLL